jgi:hypothetical protein
MHHDPVMLAVPLAGQHGAGRQAARLPLESLRQRISFGFAASFAATTEAPPRLLSRRGRDPGTRRSTGTGHTTALFAQKSQSFLDNVVAGFGLRDHQAIQHCHDPPHTAPPCTNHRFCFWRKADMPKNAIDVAIGGKATPGACGQNQRDSWN